MIANVVRFIEHLLRWNSNKDSLNGFADRIAGLRKDLMGLLSQQATQEPWKHADALANIESRLAPNRAFYAAIYDANEEVARTFLSKHGGESAVQIVGWDVLSSCLLMVAGPGRRSVEATGWSGRRGCHPGYCERHQGNRRDDFEGISEKSREVKALSYEIRLPVNSPRRKDWLRIEATE